MSNAEVANVEEVHKRLGMERRRLKNVRVHFTKMPKAPILPNVRSLAGTKRAKSRLHQPRHLDIPDISPHHSKHPKKGPTHARRSGRIALGWIDAHEGTGMALELGSSQISLKKANTLKRQQCGKKSQKKLLRKSILIEIG